MHSTLRFLVAAGTALSIITFATAAHAKKPQQQTDAPAASTPARQPLEKGMSAETVRQLVGVPAEVEPFKAPEGVAEKWIYRRVLTQRTRLISVGEGTVSCHYESPDWSDMPFARRVGVPIRRIQTTTVYQVTALLMHENKLVIAKQWNEESVRFDR